MATAQQTSMDRSFLDRTPSWVKSPWLFVVLAISLYANTIGNRYALDDGLVITENSFVQQGIAGIPDILTHDSFFGAVGNSAYLSGGRYRPLSLVTYAMEFSLFGLEPAANHAVNVLLFALSCALLLRFLRRFVFPTTPWAAWCVTLLFTIHPVHTEAVANIKGRDEILSLIFLLLTLHHALAHLHWRAQRSEIKDDRRSKRKERTGAREKAPVGRWSGVWSAVFFGLALLSKENGLVFVVILPLTIHFLTETNLQGSIKRSLPVIGMALFYVALRMLLLGARNNTVQEVMDNPYLLATLPEKLGTIAYVLLRYVKLMFWPHPLSYDYSFQQIAYRDFADSWVIASILLHGGLVAYAVLTFRKKDLLAWCILFHLGTLFLVSNLVFNIGAPMAERFLYQASVPFLIGCVELVRRLLARSAAPRAFALPLAGSLLVATALSTYAVVDRNADWKSGDDLFLHDVNVATRSARAHTFAGIALIHRSDSAATVAEKRALAQASVAELMIADSIHRDYMPTLLNMGLAYFRLDSLDAAERCWDRARLKDPKDPKLMELDAFLFDRFYRGGVSEGMKGNFPDAIRQLQKAVKYAPTNAQAWYDLGGVAYTAKDFSLARSAWERTVQLAPDHVQARQGLAALGMIGPNR